MKTRIAHTALLGSLLAVSTALLASAWPASVLAATAQPRLGTAANLAVLAGSTITNTGPSVITGDLGLAPGSAVTGFPPGTVTGVQHVTDAVALQDQTDLGTAYTDAQTATSTSDLTGQDLGGKDLIPGVYSFSSSAQLTGALTLSGDGVFIFRVGSALTTASNAVVNLVNGAQACAVYWQVGSSATLGSATQFQGNLMALTSITMNHGATMISGRALARNGALSLDDNQVTPPVGACSVGSGSGTTAVVVSSANPATVGQAVTYTATVLPQPATGTIAFADGGSVVPGCGAMSMSNGTATCSVTYASPSAHSITASYSGNNTFQATTSTSLDQTVRLTGSGSATPSTPLTPTIPSVPSTGAVDPGGAGEGFPVPVALVLLGAALVIGGSRCAQRR